MTSSENVELAVAGTRIVLSPQLGGRAISWQVDGHELLARHGDDPVEHGMYPMAPWAGRIRGNRVDSSRGRHVLPASYGPWAIHGTVFNRPVTVVARTSDDLRCNVIFESVVTTPWPWSAIVRIEWLLEMNRLTTVLEVQAVDEAFPCVVGWHPWFRREIDGVMGVWKMDATAMLLRGDDALPIAVGAVPDQGLFDDAFIVPSRSASISWPSLMELTIEADSDWFVVFDALPEAVCLEPQTGPPDGLADHPWAPVQLVEPGHPLVQTVTWTLSGRPGDRG